MSISNKTLGEPCSSNVCEEGGYELGDFISDIYNKKETSKEDTIMCKGHEKIGRGQTRKCLNGFKIKVNIKHNNSLNETGEENLMITP